MPSCWEWKHLAIGQFYSVLLSGSNISHPFSSPLLFLKNPRISPWQWGCRYWQSQCQIKYSQTSRFPPKVEEIIWNHAIKIHGGERSGEKAGLIAVQIHLFSCCFPFPLPSVGLSPSGPSPPFFCSIQRRAVRWHTGGHAQRKQFKLGFSFETEPKGVPMHTRAVGTKFCLPKKQYSGLQNQYYSPPLWPLSRLEKYESHCQIMSLFVLE